MTEAESAIRKLFDRYLDSYNRLDAEGLAELHATPTIMVHRGEVLVLTDANKLSYHESIVAENAAEGEHVWELAGFEMDQIAPNGATAKLHWIARRPDGSLLWEDFPVYLLADGGEGWLIWSNISSNPY